MVAHHTATFAEHIRELRVRFMWSLLFVAIGAGVGYALHGVILDILQQPLNEKLYYTTPTGAFSFIIKVCVLFGFIVALPMLVYQAFGFFEPLVPVKTRRSLVKFVLLSVLLAAAGIAFAYFISLPAALLFLVNFGSEAGNIQALITADEYFNFVLAYIAGFAALFQLPIIIMFINKVTPLKPSQLIGGTRYVILGSFVAAAIITPTPDPINQALMAGPIIVLYFVSVLTLAIANASKRRKNKKSSVPEMVLAGIDELLEDFEEQKQPQRQTASLASNRASASPRPVVTPLAPASRRRTVSDVMAPATRRSQTPPPPATRRQANSPQSVRRPQPATMRVRPISDFVTVSD